MNRECCGNYTDGCSENHMGGKPCPLREANEFIKKLQDARDENYRKYIAVCESAKELLDALDYSDGRVSSAKLRAALERLETR